MKPTSLRSVYKDTVSYFDSHMEEFISTPPTVFSLKTYISVPVRATSTTAVIDVTKEDSFVMAERYIIEGLNPIVLNFASDLYPGGGVKKGARAQEEDLFRRSNYYLSLNKNNVEYPLSGKIVYSPGVLICKKSNEYKWMKKFVKVSCIASAAVRNPKITMDLDKKERFMDKADREFMKNSIFSIFDIASSLKYDSLVLGAWGCGAFAGPRDDIVDLFQEAILTRGNNFTKIGFGVLVRNSKDFHNYTVFERLRELNK